MPRRASKLWEKPVEVTGASGGAYWCSLGAIYHHDVLVLFGVFLDGHYWTQFLAGQFALAAGRRLVRQGRRAVVGEADRLPRASGGDRRHAARRAVGLRPADRPTADAHPSGDRARGSLAVRPARTPLRLPGRVASHACSSAPCTLGWYDLDNDFGTQHFGAQRPGCWINFIPANGLLMVPEASSGCMCPFPNMCTVVFQSREENRQWAYFSQPGPMTPVKRLALNLGAPGDRKDASGGLWLGYPRPGGSLVLPLQIEPHALPRRWLLQSRRRASEDRRPGQAVGVLLGRARACGSARSRWPSRRTEPRATRCGWRLPSWTTRPRANASSTSSSRASSWPRTSTSSRGRRKEPRARQGVPGHRRERQTRSEFVPAPQPDARATAHPARDRGRTREGAHARFCRAVLPAEQRRARADGRAGDRQQQGRRDFAGTLRVEAPDGFQSRRPRRSCCCPTGQRTTVP